MEQHHVAKPAVYQDRVQHRGLLKFVVYVVDLSLQYQKSFHLSAHPTIKNENTTSTIDTRNSGIQATITLVRRSYLHLPPNSPFTFQDKSARSPSTAAQVKEEFEL